MHSLWTSHLKTQEEKDRFKQTIMSSSAILTRINELLDMKIKAAEKERISDKAYGQPSWAFKQADTNGVIRTLKEIKQLFDTEGTA